MMHFELSQLLLIEFSWTTSSSSALIIQINWKIKIKLKKKNQNTNSCTQKQNSAIEFTYAFNERVFFLLIQNEEKNVGPVICNLPLHDKRQSVSAGSSWFRWLLVSCWHHEMQSMQCFRSRSWFGSHFPYASVSVITLALNYGDKMCIIFSLKLKCSSRTHITWIRYNISTYSTYF